MAKDVGLSPVFLLDSLPATIKSPSMSTNPTLSQLLWRAVLTGIAAAIVLAACNVSESRLGFDCPWAVQVILLFALFFFASRIPFGQPNKA